MAARQYYFDVPETVAANAARALEMRKAGFKGGTKTGWARARQLSKPNARVTRKTLEKIAWWFSRHRYTSLPGYRRWVRAGRPAAPTAGFKADDGRAAVAWLLWGGHAAEKWVKRELKK